MEVKAENTYCKTVGIPSMDTGVDTSRNFVVYLYDGLHQSGVRPFLNGEALELGEEIDKLMEDAEMFIPIFSKDAAESELFLSAIQKMVRIALVSNRMIIPVFYGIKPIDVRHQTGGFKTAFDKHATDEDVDQEIVNEWKKALMTAAELPGHEINTMEEGQQVEKIVEQIVQSVLKEPKYAPSNLTEHTMSPPIGTTDPNIRELEDFDKKVSLSVDKDLRSYVSEVPTCSPQPSSCMISQSAKASCSIVSQSDEEAADDNDGLAESSSLASESVIMHLSSEIQSRILSRVNMEQCLRKCECYMAEKVDSAIWEAIFNDQSGRGSDLLQVVQEALSSQDVIDLLLRQLFKVFIFEGHEELTTQEIIYNALSSDLFTDAFQRFHVSGEVARGLLIDLEDFFSQYLTNMILEMYAKSFVEVYLGQVIVLRASSAMKEKILAIINIDEYLDNCHYYMDDKVTFAIRQAASDQPGGEIHKIQIMRSVLSSQEMINYLVSQLFEFFLHSNDQELETRVIIRKVLQKDIFKEDLEKFNVNDESLMELLIDSLLKFFSQYFSKKVLQVPAHSFLEIRDEGSNSFTGIGIDNLSMNEGERTINIDAETSSSTVEGIQSDAAGSPSSSTDPCG